MQDDTTQLPPVLLNDDEVRRFLVDGYLMITPTVPDGTHEIIDEKFNWLVANETNPGNNILPRVPDLNFVLESPEIRGAMISLLGENYLVHPHRFLHFRNPDAELRWDNQVEIWDRIKSQSHQDSYTPSAQPRFHYLRYARFMYYSHDVELVHGPTHVIPGSQFHAGLTEEDRERETPVIGPAGTVFLSHFDLGHAAGVNVSRRVRHMIKFIFMRAREPERPAWACESTEWKSPENRIAPADLDDAWRHHWNWLCGLKGASPANSTIRPPVDAATIESTIHRLNRGSQADRTRSIYALARAGRVAVGPLIECISDTGAEDREREGGYSSMDDAAHALAAIGGDAVEPLLPLLDSSNEWTRVNAVFALGEIGPDASKAVPAIKALLADPSHRVIRIAANALGTIGAADAGEALCDLLETERPGWREIDNSRWPIRDLVHCVAAMALARLGAAAAAVEPRIVRNLNNSFGQVGVFLCEALKRIATPTAIRALVEDLEFRRWDASLSADRPF